MKSHEEYVKQLKEINPDITIIGRYTKARERIEVKCNVCNNIWSPFAYQLIAKKPTGCPICGIEKNKKAQMKTNEQFLKEVKTKDITILEKYKGANTAIKTKCNICGYEWNCLPKDLKKIRKYPCPRCSDTIIKTTEAYSKEVAEKSNGNLKVLSEYKGATKKILAHCNVCGYEWNVMAVSLIKTNPTKCPRCNGKVPWTLDMINKKLYEIYKGSITAINANNGKKEKIVVKCSKCGFTWKTNYNQITNMSYEHGCPKCCKDKSFGEHYIEKVLTDNNINYIRNHYFVDLKDKNYLTYDFYLTDYNVLLELNGRQHYMPVQYGNISYKKAEKKFLLQLKHDIMKFLYANSNKYNFLIIKNKNLRKASKEIFDYLKYLLKEEKIC